MSREPEEATSHRPQATGEEQPRDSRFPIPDSRSAESRVTSHESRSLSRDVARTTPVDVERVEPGRDYAVDVSVLVPAKDEAENLPRFMELAARALNAASLRYEIIVIDDGSVD